MTPVDGTYTVNTTVDDLKAAGIPPGGWIPENWGDAVFVFDRGRFATTSPQRPGMCLGVRAITPSTATP